MYILGISGWYHDSAACLIKDGEIVAAAQEERFTRIKHDSNFPSHAVEYCMNEGGINCCELDNVIFYDKPFIKFERILETYLAFAPKGFSSFYRTIPLWIKDKLFQKRLLFNELKHSLDESVDWNKLLLFSEHHLSHAASAFFPSNFEKAAILTLDGVGEWTTTSIAVGNKNKINVLKEIHFPHSLGLLYSAFTYYTGFKVNSGEYKLMGLAPYGEPIYVELIKDHLVNIKDDGSFQLNMQYFDYCSGFRMTNKKFDKLFKGKARESETNITKREMDLASSIQKVTEEIVIKIAKEIVKETGEKNLCLAGGVALNCVANGILARENLFENIWIQPASGDAGGALGAALVAYFIKHNQPRLISKSRDEMKGAYLGPKYDDSETENALVKINANFVKLDENEVIRKTAHALSEGKAIGWMQGRMEFGPRALGNRSIIADPRLPSMQKLLNLKVKFRESFRPFAPSILRENLEEWFELNIDSPYMLLVAYLNQSKRLKMTDREEDLFGIDKLNIIRSEVSAITHVDYTARIQTVHEDTNAKYYKLIKEFNSITGCPILVNTSFNVRGEPIVCSPEDAFNCFMGTDIDMLIIGNIVLEKEKQDNKLKINYSDKYELD